MGSELRTAFFVVAAVVLLVAVLIECGSSLMTGGGKPSKVQLQSAAQKELPGDASGEIDFESVSPKKARPGLGITYLALVDGLLLLTVGLMLLSLLLPARIHGRAQGWITLGVTFLIAVTGVWGVTKALPQLMTMIGLFLAAPFGTLCYLAVWGFFDRGGAAETLGMLMLLKLAFAILLVLAHQRFLQNKGLVLLVVTSLVANVLISFLHGFVPGILVSITDAAGAIAVAVMAILWSIVLLFGAIGAIFKSLKLEKSSA